MKELKIEDIVKMSEELAVGEAKLKTNPYIIPLYAVVDIDEETGLIKSVSQHPNNFMLGKKIIV